MTLPPARPDTLAAVETALWRELVRAPRDKHHAWRVGVLATVDGDGADARSVVLREVQADTRTLLFYTDSRSAKAAQIEAHPQGTVVLWSPALGWQLRLRVMLALETAGLQVSSRWAQLKLTPAAQDYLSPLAPGSVLGSATPPRESREHFAVLSAQVLSVDWLELHADGHRRARFNAQGAAWLTP